jgi:hypothetical protein
MKQKEQQVDSHFIALISFNKVQTQEFYQLGNLSFEGLFELLFLVFIFCFETFVVSSISYLRGLSAKIQ